MAESEIDGGERSVNEGNPQQGTENTSKQAAKDIAVFSAETIGKLNPRIYHQPDAVIN